MRANLRTIQLARAESWQHLEATQCTWLLERRESLIELCEQAMLIEWPGAELERGRHDLAEIRIWHAEYQCCLDSVAGLQGVFDLARIDVLAAGDDQLTFATEDEQPEFRIELATVA